MSCDSCNMVSIQGVPCHETGCPDAWKTTEIECEDCGCAFIPEDRGMTRCDGCECEYQDSGWYYEGNDSYEYEDDPVSMQYDHFDSDLWNEW